MCVEIIYFFQVVTVKIQIPIDFMTEFPLKQKNMKRLFQHFNGEAKNLQRYLLSSKQVSILSLQTALYMNGLSITLNFFPPRKS